MILLKRRMIKDNEDDEEASQRSVNQVRSSWIRLMVSGPKMIRCSVKN